MKRPFSDREIETLRKLWLQGISDSVIAERLGRHRGVVRRKSSELDLPSIRSIRLCLKEFA